MTLEFHIADKPKLCVECGELIKRGENCFCDEGIYLHGCCDIERKLTAQVTEEVR